MTLAELLTHKMQASSGNEAAFEAAYLSASGPGNSATRLTIATRWAYPPSPADLGEARALICTLPNFRYAAESRSIESVNHFHGTGSASDPGMN